MSDLAGVLDELVADAPVGALNWNDVEARSQCSQQRLRRSPRRSIIVALAGAVALAVVGTAVGVGITLLDQQERFHASAPDDPQRHGPLVEVTSGEDWALIAWQSNFGVCLDFAIPGNSPFGCDFPVRGAKPTTDSSGSGPPMHAVAGRVSSSRLVGGDGKTTIFGVAAEDVAAVKLELTDGRLVDAPLYDAPADLDANVRFYIVRLLLASSQRRPAAPSRGYGPNGSSLGSDSPVRAYIAYGRNGALIERVEG
jgi:hypothetical protein